MNIQYCEDCAKKILETWKGWPHKDAIPHLPKIVGATCNICEGTNNLQSNRITWFNYHSEYSTGLPDYWLLVIDGDRKKWGLPYYAEGSCPKCGAVSNISEMKYPNGKHEYKSNCENCGIYNAKNDGK